MQSELEFEYSAWARYYELKLGTHIGEPSLDKKWGSCQARARAQQKI